MIAIPKLSPYKTLLLPFQSDEKRNLYKQTNSHLPNIIVDALKSDYTHFTTPLGHIKFIL